MKTTICKKELIELDACASGLATFVKSHGEAVVNFSQALRSNGWDDIWWLIVNIWDKLSKQQQDDLHLIGCDWAESALASFESEYPNDFRPRKAIKAKRDYIKGLITEEDLEYARCDAESAVLSATKSDASSAAETAFWCASYAPNSAKDAAKFASWSSEYAAMEKFEAELMELFVKWEGGLTGSEEVEVFDNWMSGEGKQ